jgi:multidrug efflux pump subunit AcrB
MPSEKPRSTPEGEGPWLLGGLLSSTFLNLVVVPVLFARWGSDPTRD